MQYSARILSLRKLCFVFFKYQDVLLWDSIGHMTFVTILEFSFDIMMEANDIIDLYSYEKGKEIFMWYDVKILSFES